MNCTISRTARIPAMEVSRSSLMLKKNASVPSASNEMCGNFFVGCNRPKIGKKFPSSAAEYGTREYPSKTENTEASAIHKRADDEFGILRFPPRNYSQNARLHRHVQHGDSKHREKNPTRNVFFRLANLATQIANVVVAPVAVNCADHRRTKPCEP